ncbi:MAG TPA: hypothetical protein VL463_01950 [Kofleriaceae bacterium]|jgi:hypothetical protein|nr:hypothetical protein [Kofleriaceae bacterium]
MDRLPQARVVPAPLRASVRASFARAWARAAPQVLVLALTAIAFAGMLGLTFLVAQHAITAHATTFEPIERPMTIYFMKQPPVQTLRAMPLQPSLARTE